MAVLHMALRRGHVYVVASGLESPFVYKTEEQHLKNYTREKSAREEADYPVAACFPKCFAFLRNPNLLLLDSHYKARKESG